MRDRHLREAVHQQQGDDRGENVAEDDAGPGGANRQRAAQEQSRADGATDSDHAQLAFGELARQALLVGDRVLVMRSVRPRDGSAAITPSLSRAGEDKAHKFDQSVEVVRGC